jgi:hypothetical protein
LSQYRVFLSAFTYIPSNKTEKRDSSKEKKLLSIRIGFIANPDPAFNLNADPNPNPGAKPMWIHAESDPGLTVTSQKFDYSIENILSIGNRS